jgi:hypothetical protein
MHNISEGFLWYLAFLFSVVIHLLFINILYPDYGYH